MMRDPSNRAMLAIVPQWLRQHGVFRSYDWSFRGRVAEGTLKR